MLTIFATRQLAKELFEAGVNSGNLVFNITEQKLIFRVMNLNFLRDK